MSSPRIVHIIHRLGTGGLENGVVNLINRMPGEVAEHTIVAMAGVTRFRDRLEREDVSIVSLDKREGKDPGAYLRLWRLLRKLRPDIVHTRNLGTLDCALVARAAGVPCRIHGEHGWDLVDAQGRSRKYRLLRRVCDAAVTHYVAVSRDLRRWQIEELGIAESRTSYIPNGVDTEKFRPADDSETTDPVTEAFGRRPDVVFGWVGRMHAIKNPVGLVQAFAKTAGVAAKQGRSVGLVMVGEGPLLPDVHAALRRPDLARDVWLTGMRDDVDRLMRAFDVFVLPSLNEGMSNTILEAMASGVPVVAARVGGNAELVPDGECGLLTEDASAEALAPAMCRYVTEPALAARHGAAARARALECYGLNGMIERYRSLYERLLQNPQNS